MERHDRISVREWSNNNNNNNNNKNSYELLEPVTEKELDHAMKDLDENSTGVVEFQSFLLWCAHTLPSNRRTAAAATTTTTTTTTTITHKWRHH